MYFKILNPEQLIILLSKLYNIDFTFSHLCVYFYDTNNMYLTYFTVVCPLFNLDK